MYFLGTSQTALNYLITALPIPKTGVAVFLNVRFQCVSRKGQHQQNHPLSCLQADHVTPLALCPQFIKQSFGAWLARTEGAVCKSTKTEPACKDCSAGAVIVSLLLFNCYSQRSHYYHFPRSCGLPPPLPSFIFIAFIYFCVFGPGRVRAVACEWKSEDSVWELALSFHHRVPEIELRSSGLAVSLPAASPLYRSHT